MRKIIIKIVFVFTIIVLLFKSSIIIKKEISNSSMYFIKNVVPALYPVMIISYYLKHNVLNKTNNKFIWFITSALTFAPSNALLTKNNKLIFFSTNINPFYSYSMIKILLNKNLAFKIVIINLVINYIFLFINTFKNNNENIKIEDKKITDIIKDSSINIINIYGITLFFTLINTLLIQIKIPIIFIIFTDVINGFNLLINIRKCKLLLVILLNSFTGLSIIFQIKSINEDIKYKFIIYKFILSIITLILTLIII